MPVTVDVQVQDLYVVKVVEGMEGGGKWKWCVKRWVSSYSSYKKYSKQRLETVWLSSDQIQTNFPYKKFQ